ncbi:hypothetical protein RVR_7326 [Actinacidiphila reveromycinica]|uniref:Glutamine amidotransferase type-2 domain-containing protein n=1 Tax=Actinacidiphila reveromycinica TaxID=659352 RepID=A0A7U3UX07_9ACTN|nr:class II glutamine amidotransferase [Streptomyces sp. SN-593]BBB00317.1 hypothetical protein RVR_7326 [Streptomyces sp. SN-593]
MCRLMAAVARSPRPLDDLFAEDLDPFVSLACEHSHGWGVASITRHGTVGFVKEPERADESAWFHGLMVDRTTDAALLHLRMASPQYPVVYGNTHPFGDRRTAFVHNGDFHPAGCLDDLIGAPLLATVEGETDSERYYLAVRRRIDDGVPPPKAIAETAAAIRARCTRFASLNCMLLTPEAVFAYTSHDPYGEVIGRRGAGYFSLSYRVDPDKVLVASAGWPQDPPRWSALPEGHVLEISRGGLAVTVHPF